MLWDWLHRLMDASAPDSVMSLLLKANLLKKLPEREGSTVWLELLAAICPSPQRADLRAQLAEFEPAQSANSLALLDILDGMEKNRTHV